MRDRIEGAKTLVDIEDRGRWIDRAIDRTHALTIPATAQRPPSPLSQVGA
jgi:hypothetical protein